MLVRVRASGVLAVVGRSERRGRLFSGCLLLIFTHFSIVHRELWCGGFVWRIVCQFIRFHSAIIIIVFPSVDFVGRLGLSAQSSIHPINYPLPA